MTTIPELDPALFAAHELLLVPDLVMLRDGPHADLAVLVRGSRFAAIGQTETILSAHEEVPPVRMPGKLLMPGFIDAHHHLTQSFGKSLAFGEPSEIYRRIWVPLEGALGDELVYASAKLATLEALRGGFTTVCEAGTRAEGRVDAVAAAVRDAGLRCVLGLICNDIADGTALEWAPIASRAREHLARWQGDSLIHPSLAISVPESATDETLTRVYTMCAEAGAVFQVHVNEHLAAVERSLVERRLRPLEHLEAVEALGPHTLVAHATLVTPYEIELLRDTDTAVSYNPVASQWKGNAVANAVMMDAVGIRFGIGTDGTRSDGFRLMDAAEATQRLAFGLETGDSSCGGGLTWLEHATWSGAQAVGLGAVTGEIAAGKAADFLVVDLDVPEMKPSWDVGWELVRFGNRDQIVAVVIAGVLRLWKGWPVDWDARTLMRDITGIARTAVANAPIQKVHARSAEYRARLRARPRVR